ncbi:MAG TPA: AMP-binding protein [Sporichthyaceae bacterium]|jgi:putative long chain acyl-CoA synthase
MELVPDLLARPARQLWSAAGNALELARFGGLDTGEAPSPFDVVAHTSMFRLRRYFPPAPGTATGPALILVPPLMMSAEVYDVSPATSAVAILHRAGVDPWVVDFGAPEHEQGGLQRDVADHVRAVSEAVDRVVEQVGGPVHLGGYSQGGMFAYQTAAYRRSADLAGLVTFGSPVDFRASRVFGVLSEQMVSDVLAALADNVLVHVSLPAWASRFGFRLLDPVKSVRGRLDFLRQLHDRDALLPRERQRQFLDNHGYVAYPGPAVADLVKQFVAHNRMLSGGLVVGDVVATLADISCPVLIFVGSVDTIAPPASVRAIVRAAPAADVHQCVTPTGHFGLVVGGGASRRTWPTVAGWLAYQDGSGPYPDTVSPLGDEDAADEGIPNPIGAGVESTAALLSAARAVGLSALDRARSAAGSVVGVVQAVPGLARLEHARNDGRASVSALLAERARRNSEDTFFVYDGRGHTYAAAQARVDAVVRGLLSVGVGQGEHVGVLMRTRPSALTAIAALNRIGAVAVLLRPDGPTSREVALAGLQRTIADPENLSTARAARLEVLLLGSGEREPRRGVIDLEAIDPDAVALPAWYTPNPGRAGDPAFLLFAGEGREIRMTRITNGRWALSAFGTASAAGLRSTDTVYNLAPLHHAGGLLTAVGGALAGGARLAMAGATDPQTFWTEVRRYGVTVVPYTWTSLRPLIEATPGPAERHHPVRLFVGSGMPGWLWRRVRDRFPTVGVLEFFATGEQDVVLANTSGVKVGAKGRPLPGSAEVRLIRWNVDKSRPVTGPDGFAVECADDQVGLLVAAAGPNAGGDRLLRGLFSPADRWSSTEHLFRRDADGDHWLVARLTDLVHTRNGAAAPAAAEDALGALPNVELVVAHAEEDPGGGPDRLAAALVLRPGTSVSAEALSAAVAGLSRADRPDLIRVVASLPVSAWGRPHRTAAAAAVSPSDPGWTLAPAGYYWTGPAAIEAQPPSGPR